MTMGRMSWCADLLVVAVEQREERRLRASRTLNTAETEVVSCPGQIAQIPKEFLHAGSYYGHEPLDKRAG